jgi:hypothetical protein
MPGIEVDVDGVELAAATDFVAAGALALSASEPWPSAKPKTAARTAVPLRNTIAAIAAGEIPGPVDGGRLVMVLIADHLLWSSVQMVDPRDTQGIGADA